MLAHCSGTTAEPLALRILAPPSAEAVGDLDEWGQGLGTDPVKTGWIVRSVNVCARARTLCLALSLTVVVRGAVQ